MQVSQLTLGFLIGTSILGVVYIIIMVKTALSVKGLKP
jgi:tetrahydromethanopterin S-methyltransferase subunit B